MPDVVRLTVVESQGESDVICSFLRTEGIRCNDRAAPSPPHNSEQGGGFGGRRAILLSEPDLDRARELLDATSKD